MSPNRVHYERKRKSKNKKQGYDNTKMQRKNNIGQEEIRKYRNYERNRTRGG